MGECTLLTQPNVLRPSPQEEGNLAAHVGREDEKLAPECMLSDEEAHEIAEVCIKGDLDWRKVEERIFRRRCLQALREWLEKLSDAAIVKVL
jgi:hypothetical protein